MLITTNSKNIFNKYNKFESISSFNEKSDDINSYQRIQAAIISNDLNQLIQELKNGINPNCQM